MEFENQYGLGMTQKYDCLLFDLDDTLYPLSTGIARECGKNIKDYMIEKLGIPKDKIVELSDLLYKNYGTTMAGLRAIGYEFDYDEYHSFVHGRLPYDNLKPDPLLRSLLLSLPLRKVIFTNADRVHAAKALKKLGLEDCFQGIICFETLNPMDNNAASHHSKIFDIVGHFSSSEPVGSLPKTPISNNSKTLSHSDTSERPKQVSEKPKHQKSVLQKQNPITKSQKQSNLTQRMCAQGTTATAHQIQLNNRFQSLTMCT